MGALLDHGLCNILRITGMYEDKNDPKKQNYFAEPKVDIVADRRHRLGLIADVHLVKTDCWETSWSCLVRPEMGEPISHMTESRIMFLCLLYFVQ